MAIVEKNSSNGVVAKKNAAADREPDLETMQIVIKPILLKHGFMMSPYLSSEARALKADIKDVAPGKTVNFYSEDAAKNAQNDVTIKMYCDQKGLNAEITCDTNLAEKIEPVLDKYTRKQKAMEK